MDRELPPARWPRSMPIFPPPGGWKSASTRRNAVPRPSLAGKVRSGGTVIGEGSACSEGPRGPGESPEIVAASWPG